ncbi:hypothetical protein SLW70_05620 [Flavobacterium sp. NG2]|uniref:DUF7793 family protein n=1 Tax=Flavobacterium sp. NG2 TaxID=3097547 RepID=UPI002A7F139A|nr:hypothetical protein [Flavobacterium sp. NG2]WPR72615.1 hypothetical protein SLW70_05620 [Flavobacterium sp. NG2]
MKVVENDFVKFWIEDDILYSKFKKPINGTKETLKKIIDLRTEISEGKKQYWCYDFNGIKSHDKAARDYADKYGQDHLYACAVVLNTLIAKIILNTFILMKKPIVPLKGFTSKEEAIIWLRELRKKNEQSSAI